MQKITLDSNVWRDPLFINWLQSDRSVHETHICPIIVYLETRLWYDMRGLTEADYREDLIKLKTQVVLFSKPHTETVIALTRQSHLPFRQHARDFMIGAIVLAEESVLITQNTRHFVWLPEHQLTTPQEFLQAAVFE